MEKIQANMCFDVVFSSKNMQTCLFTRFPVFSPFSARFYPSLHHNGKGSIVLIYRYGLGLVRKRLNYEFELQVMFSFGDMHTQNLNSK